MSFSRSNLCFLIVLTGNSAKGLYVSKHCDTMLKYAEDHNETKSLWIIIHKVCWFFHLKIVQLCPWGYTMARLLESLIRSLASALLIGIQWPTTQY